MTREIVLQGVTISYTLRVHPRSRGIRVSIIPPGNLVVTKSRWISNIEIERFLHTKAAWVLTHLQASAARPHFNLKGSAHQYQKHKTQAKELVEIRLKHLCSKHNFSYSRVSIRNQNTRWGSCSQNGNLQFNYKIALLPPDLAEYIIVHELCHTRELNHSHQFWKEVETCLPNYQSLRKKLRDIGIQPH